MRDCEALVEHLDELNVNYGEAVAHDKEIASLRAELTKYAALKASLEQKKMYEQMMEKLQENIEKQQVAVRQISDLDVPEVAGLEMLDGRFS